MAPDGPSPGEPVELLVADPSRQALGEQLLRDRGELSRRALRLLRTYLHEGFAPERGSFWLETIEVHAAGDDELGDLTLSFSFSGAEDRFVEPDTVFEVRLHLHEPPRERYWPFALTIGFR